MMERLFLESAFEGKSEDEIEMMKIMGFGGFGTTKGKKVPGNDVGSANIVQKRRYRCVQEKINFIY